MSFSVLLIFLPTICLSVPALVPFDFVNDVVSQTGTGTVVIGISYLGPPGPGQVNVIQGQDKAPLRSICYMLVARVCLLALANLVALGSCLTLP